MISSGPFRGLFLFLGTAEFLHLIATRGASPQGPKKRLEFCEISHERGARSPANAPRDWTPPTHGTPPGGRRRGSTAPGGAAGRGGPGYPGTPPAGRLPRSGAAAQPPPGAAGYPGGDARPVRGTCGAATPGGYLPGPGGYRAKQAAFRAARRGWRGGLPGGAATPVAYTAYAGAATGRAGAGRRATPGAARRHSYPRAGATPGGYPRRSWRSYAASCDGYAPTSWGGRLLKPGLPGAAREKGSPGRACRAKNPCARLSRAYKEALFPGSPRGFFLDKTS